MINAVLSQLQEFDTYLEFYIAEKLVPYLPHGPTPFFAQYLDVAFKALLYGLIVTIFLLPVKLFAPYSFKVNLFLSILLLLIAASVSLIILAFFQILFT